MLKLLQELVKGEASAKDKGYKDIEEVTELFGVKTD